MYLVFAVTTLLLVLSSHVLSAPVDSAKDASSVKDIRECEPDMLSNSTRCLINISEAPCEDVSIDVCTCPSGKSCHIDDLKACSFSCTDVVVTYSRRGKKDFNMDILRGSEIPGFSADEVTPAKED